MAVAAFRPRRDAPFSVSPGLLGAAVPGVIVARCSRGGSSFARLCGSAAFGLVAGCPVSVSPGLLGATAPGVVVAKLLAGPSFLCTASRFSRNRRSSRTRGRRHSGSLAATTPLPLNSPG
jgi:hypothetical protein